MPKDVRRVAYLIGLLLFACGGRDASVIDGEWAYSFNGAACNNGSVAGGTLVIYEKAGDLSGQYDVCGASVASDDLHGRVRGDLFELSMFDGSIGIVEGKVAAFELTGRVTGLGEGVAFKATRVGHGKSLPPPDKP